MRFDDLITTGDGAPDSVVRKAFSAMDGDFLAALSFVMPSRSGASKRNPSPRTGTRSPSSSSPSSSSSSSSSSRRGPQSPPPGPSSATTLISNSPYATPTATLNSPSAIERPYPPSSPPTPVPGQSNRGGAASIYGISSSATAHSSNGSTVSPDDVGVEVKSAGSPRLSSTAPAGENESAGSCVPGSSGGISSTSSSYGSSGPISASPPGRSATSHQQHHGTSSEHPKLSHSHSSSYLSKWTKKAKKAAGLSSSDKHKHKSKPKTTDRHHTEEIVRSNSEVPGSDNVPEITFPPRGASPRGTIVVEDYMPSPPKSGGFILSMSSNAVTGASTDLSSTAVATNEPQDAQQKEETSGSSVTEPTVSKQTIEATTNETAPVVSNVQPSTEAILDQTNVAPTATEPEPSQATATTSATSTTPAPLTTSSTSVPLQSLLASSPPSSSSMPLHGTTDAVQSQQTSSPVVQLPNSLQSAASASSTSSSFLASSSSASSSSSSSSTPGLSSSNSSARSSFSLSFASLSSSRPRKGSGGSKHATVDAAALQKMWRPDSDVKKCQRCGSKFTFVNRRHHCRCCGDIFCGDCSAYTLKNKKGHSVRVCNPCFYKGRTITCEEDYSSDEEEEARPNSARSRRNSDVTAKDRPAVAAASSPSNQLLAARSDELKPATATTTTDGSNVSDEKARLSRSAGETKLVAAETAVVNDPALGGASRPVSVYRQTAETSTESDSAENFLNKAISSLHSSQRRVEAEPKEDEQIPDWMKQRRARLEAVEKQHRLRRNVVMELLQTERTYVGQLCTVVENMIEPLSKTRLSTKELQGIFLNMPQLYAHHRALLSRLEERIDHWHTESLIGDIFVKYTDFLGEYGGYLKHYNPNLLDLYCNIQEFKELKDAFERKQAMTTGLDLPSFLILPVQRIPRYILFFKELCKCTQTIHPDHSWVHQAYEKLAAMMSELNSNMHKKLHKITNPLVDNIISLNTPTGIVMPPPPRAQPAATAPGTNTQPATSSSASVPPLNLQSGQSSTDNGSTGPNAPSPRGSSPRTLSPRGGRLNG